MIHVAALAFTVAGTVCVLLLLGVLCVRTVFSVAKTAFFRCSNPGGNTRGKRGKKLVLCVAGLSRCISKSAGRLNSMVVKEKTRH